MRLIKKIKKGTAVILSAALMAGLVPFMPHSVSKVQAAAGSKKPSVTAYATKEQLMDETFTPNYKGISDIFEIFLIFLSQILACFQLRICANPTG